MQIPFFLDLDHVLRLHNDMIENYGGPHGIRDLGLLLSAIATPQTAYEGEYIHGDIHEMAAAYMYHIVQNHPFIDGNKRTGAAAAIVFLAMNDISVANDEQGLVDLTLSVARGQAGKADIAEFFRSKVQ
jgi:death-on-curing protein